MKNQSTIETEARGGSCAPVTCSAASLFGYILGTLSGGIVIHYLMPEIMSLWSLYWMNMGIIMFWWSHRK